MSMKEREQKVRRINGEISEESSDDATEDPFPEFEDIPKPHIVQPDEPDKNVALSKLSKKTIKKFKAWEYRKMTE